MKNMSVSRRYAKALLILGKENDQADLYGEELNSFAHLIANEKEFCQVISNPLYGAESRKMILTQVLEKMNLSRVINSFLLLLFDKRRLGFIDSINEFYQSLADELKGIARASLVSATDLSSDALEQIRSALSQMTGKQIIIDFNQDPKLIGGVVAKIGDLVLDGSIKTQLLSMKESIKRGESI
ncbi:MAG: F-type H+-transporting ATPase subunit delta [Candidatus Magnetoglobus multicellularis str. Araruama]|uniref:ATP synthase subunit delta n=1 Tax=Candidatus Magnetoglobus multicellularis str. Araruama TaxID=890399 RepID=A0A1V1P9K4_9BACT|nr:MAG: F-type H+-transporting ATPase subunit delta [Candidatus Magnetoglobus multicellularis str. Araruama]